MLIVAWGVVLNSSVTCVCRRPKAVSLDLASFAAPSVPIPDRGGVAGSAVPAQKRWRPPSGRGVIERLKSVARRV